MQIYIPSISLACYVYPLCKNSWVKLDKRASFTYEQNWMDGWMDG